MFLKKKTGLAYHKIFNLGNNKPVSVNKIILILEKILNKKAKKVFTTMQLGDVKNTFADIEKSKKILGFNPGTEIEKGLEKFVMWFKDYSK